MARTGRSGFHSTLHQMVQRSPPVQGHETITFRPRETLDMARNLSDLLINDSPVFIVMTDVEGNILMMNDSMLQVLDYSRDEVLGKALADCFVKEENCERLREGFEKSIQSCEVISVEICLQAKNGRDLPVRWQIQPTLKHDGAVDFLFGVGIDLAERREMEQKIRESERRYRGLFQMVHLPMFLLDPSDGSIIDANPAACQFYGYTPEQITAMKITQINTLDPSIVCREMGRAAVGDANHFFFKHRLANGTIRDVEVFACGINISDRSFLYTVVYDITERKRMEEELMREREEQYLLFDSIPAMIFYKNRRNRFIRVNRAFADFYGLSQKEIEGFTMEDLFPENAEKSYQNDLVVLETGKPRTGILDMIDTRSGPKWIQTDKLPFRDENGNIVGILGFSTDITEPKKAGEAIQALVESASDANGHNYFNRMINHICEWLGADFALVVQILDKDHIKVLSINSAGNEIASAEKEFRKTPLSPLIEQGFLYIPENTCKLFPHMESVIHVNAEGFVGIVIQGRDGCPAGLICAISLRKMILPKRAEEVLRIFASKAFLEMERIRSEVALRESEERYRSLVETSPDAIAMTDFDGNIITANHRFAALLGLKSPAGSISAVHNVVSYLSPKDRARAGKKIFALLSGKSSRVSDEFTIIRSDGTVFPSEVSASLVRDEHSNPQAFIGIMRDITERKEAETRLYEEHARLEYRLRNERLISEIASLLNSADTLDVVLERIAVLIMKSIPVSNIYLYRFDTDEEKLVSSHQWSYSSEQEISGNDSFIKIIDSPLFITRLRTGDSLIFNTFSDFPESDRASFHAIGIRSLVVFPLGTEGILRGAIGFCRKSEGEWEPEEHSLFRIVADMISNAFERDDNFQARIEAERSHAEAVKMAERSSRLASIGTLAAGISHEINQPLTALKVKVDSILYWQEMNVAMPPEDLTQDLQFISQQTERIDDIIKHMRALARQEKGGAPSEITINPIINEVLSLLRQRISARGIRLELRLDDTLPPVKGHKTLLHQVVINLIVNAVDALAASSRADKAIVVSTGVQDGFCCFEVFDNGPGIPENIMNRLFDPFFSTKIGSEGMGLGLSICHNIVTGLGGTITVANRPEGGARFTVSIPASYETRRNS